MFKGYKVSILYTTKHINIINHNNKQYVKCFTVKLITLFDKNKTICEQCLPEKNIITAMPNFIEVI